jgi:hypothetical protein
VPDPEESYTSVKKRNIHKEKLMPKVIRFFSLAAAVTALIFFVSCLKPERTAADLVLLNGKIIKKLN